MKRTFENEMERYRILIYGIKDNPEIKTRIAPIYSEERLTLGETLYQAAKDAAFAQNKEKNEASVAVDLLDETKEELHSALVKARKAARYFFKNDLQLYKTMQLGVSIPTSYAAWKNQLELSFKTIKSNPVVLEKLALTGLGEEQIDTYIAKIDSLDQLQLNAEKEDGEAQQATQTKTETFNALKAYCTDLYECINLFYEDNERQKLEEVGILVR